MKVSELIERLQQLDPDMRVMFQYTYSSSFSSCCNMEHYEETEERDVDSVAVGATRENTWAKGPRGGKEAWRMVDVPVVLLGEYL